MGFFKFLKRLTSNIKCDNTFLQKSTWVFYGNKMQKVKLNESIFVDNGQLCIISCKSKITDVLDAGKYKVNSVDLPKTFKVLNVDKKIQAKKLKKVSFDIYFLNNDFINYSFVYFNKYKVNKTKYSEQITCDVKFKISNLKTHLQYLFLTRSYVPTKLYQEVVFSKIDNIVLSGIEGYNGELVDLQDEIIASGIKLKLQKEVAEIGFEISSFAMEDYEIKSNRKPAKIKKQDLNFDKDAQTYDGTLKQESDTDVEPASYYQNLAKDDILLKKPKEETNYQNAVKNGIIFYDPNEEN